MNKWACLLLVALTASPAAMAFDRPPPWLLPPSTGGGGGTTSLPEPGSLLLLGAGLAAAGLMGARSKRKGKK
jgi:hypothetical protein